MRTIPCRSLRPSRRFVLAGLVGLAGTTGLAGIGTKPAQAAAPAVLKGAGDFRSIRIFSNRTGDWLDTVYWVEGEYIPDALDAVNHLMRDWREDLVAPIAPATIDIMAATHRLLECTEPFEVVSGYRSPKTNAMLRRRSRRVARNSYHVKAMAVDLTLKSRTPRQISAAARSLGAGGVGTYTRAEFVHLDSGPIRDWGR